MTDNEFQAILNYRLKKISEVLGHKAAEYARGDRLSNFKRAAVAMQTTPEAACVGFWMKHVVSLLDLVDDIDRGKVATMAMWQEKLGDAINYLVLLEALVAERTALAALDDGKNV